MAKTHCKRGHEYTEENTVWSRGTRSCKQCKRDRDMIRGRKNQRPERYRDSSLDGKEYTKPVIIMSEREALLLLLDQVDYTKGACAPTEMVSAALSVEVLARCHETIERTRADG